MVCKYCKKEFSNPTIEAHLLRCAKNPKNRPKKQPAKKNLKK